MKYQDLKMLSRAINGGCFMGLFLVLLCLPTVSYAEIRFRTGLWEKDGIYICINNPKGPTFSEIARRMAKEFAGMSGTGPVIGECKVGKHSEWGSGYILHLNCSQQYPNHMMSYTPIDIIVKLKNSSIERIEKYPPIPPGQKAITYIDKYRFVSNNCQASGHSELPIILPKGTTIMYPFSSNK